MTTGEEKKKENLDENGVSFPQSKNYLTETDTEDIEYLREKKKKEAEKPKIKEDTSSKMGRQLAAFKSGAGTGNIAGGIAEVGFSQAEDARNAELKKAKEALEQGKITLEGFYDEYVVKKNDPNAFIGMMGDHVAKLGHFEATAKFKNLKEFAESKAEALQAIIDLGQKQYFAENGALNIDYIKQQAKARVGDKPETSRATLDYAQEQGPQQIDMPEMPDDIAAYIGETAVALLGDITANAIAMAQGGTSLTAKTRAGNAFDETANRVAAFMTMDVAQYREKKEKIMLLNEELKMKYQDNVMKLMLDFEQRSTADERMYNQMMFDATAQEIRNAYQFLGMKARMTEFEGNIARFKDQVVNNMELDNTQAQRNADLYYKRELMENRRNDAKVTHDIMMFKLRQKQLRQQAKRKPYEILETMVSSIPDSMQESYVSATNWGTSTLADTDKLPDTQINRDNIAAGSTRGGAFYKAIRESGLDKDVQDRAINNIMALISLRIYPTNFTPEAIKDIGSEDIRQSLIAKNIVASNKVMQHFKKGDDNQLGLMAGFAVGMGMGVANTQAKTNYAIKQSKKLEPKETAKFMAGE